MSTNQALQAIKAAARQCLTLGHYHEAQRLLDPATGIIADAEIWLLRGAANGLAGDQQNARRCFQEAIHLQPGWAEAHFNLGNALLVQGELHAAAGAFATAIRHKPDYQQAVAAFRWTDRQRWGKQRIAVEIEGGLRVVCPRSLQCTTTYVLLEQEDWFEPEIHFLRRLAQPGMTAADIGANHGVYSLTLAKAAGTSGHIWAFEPASDPADCLAESLVLNDLSNVTLVRCALTSHEGEGTLLIEESPELNRLVDAATSATDQVETVRLSTLDACAAEFGWRDIDFIKIDAEGAEAEIIEGGRKFLSSSSPLIMFEVQHKSRLNHGLVDRFRALGFESYRFVPGVCALVPWNETQANQYSPVNLFCARPDRADILAQRGLLIRAEDLQHEPPSTKDAWDKLYARLPCYQDEGFARLAARTPGQPEDPALANYYGALDAYAASCDMERTVRDRYLALDLAYARADTAQQTEWRPEYAALHARIAFALDRRVEALQSLYTLLSHLRTNKPEPALPLLPPDARFDAIPVKSYASFPDWFLCSALEACARYGAWSSLWAGQNEFSAHSWLNASAQYQTAEMGRRRMLLEYCRCEKISPPPERSRAGIAGSRNDALWDALAQAHAGGHAA